LSLEFFPSTEIDFRRIAYFSQFCYTKHNYYESFSGRFSLTFDGDVDLSIFVMVILDRYLNSTKGIKPMVPGTVSEGLISIVTSLVL